MESLTENQLRQMSEKIDIVIPLGRGSKFQDMELRYSLRSIEKFVKNYRHIYIVGELPKWITGVMHIPFQEYWQREANIMRKVLASCTEKGVSENFLFGNDDFFFLQPVDASQYPYYCRERIEDIYMNYSGIYRSSVVNTMVALKEKEFADKYFDVHCPVIYNKEKFKEIVMQFNWEVLGSLVVKSIYCNTLQIEGEIFNDCKIQRPLTYSEINERISDRHIFSVGDKGLNADMWRLLKELFPNKSKYEK